MTQFSLSDRYAVTRGRIFLSGMQALVRLPVDIARRDRLLGRNTAGYISGYEGSPLAGYDLELGRQRALLAEYGIVFKPGLNEELAANAVEGSQLASASPSRTVDGVCGYWYGKAPGLDRASDAFRHANLGGADRNGGVLVFVGDDAVAKSSTVPSSSEIAIAELGMAVLSPSNPQDILDLGMHGIEMSRFSGLWVALKIATNVADGGATTDVDIDRVQPMHPDNAIDGKPFVHEVSAHFLQPTLGQLEHSLLNERVELARRYIVANALNRVIGATDAPKIGIISAGGTYLDLRQALNGLGLDDASLAAHGISILKLGAVYPLVPDQIRSFAEGLDQLIIVEEKRSFVESQVKDILYGIDGAPPVFGKQTPSGDALLRATADLNPEIIASALRRAFPASIGVPAQPALAPTARTPSPLPVISRTPYFCSGCPHNRSTRTPDGSVVGAGIGCSGMVIMMPAKRVGNVVGITQMGGEGGTWAGMQPFVGEQHMIQNMGDGTYHHSGSLAIRAAVASGTNITFKILYNSTVAMTGGQNAVGGMSVPSLVRELQAEGVRKIVITAADPGRYRNVDLPLDVDVQHRDAVVQVQQELARIPGVTILINDQECATELRRKRKRKLVHQPLTRIFINERVCEGCGDCGDKSNCMSVQPVATEYGRKTRIHQASCNSDYSCLKGDCPSFLTVVTAHHGQGRPVHAIVADLDASQLPQPTLKVDSSNFGMRITGIGGTGVVTVAQIIATAAAMEGRSVQSLDQTGLAQKGGAVVSDVKISTMAIEQANRVGAGQADLYLGCDLLVAASDVYLGVASPERTVAIVSTAEVPTGAMVTDTSVSFPEASATRGKIASSTRGDLSAFADARALTLDLFGDDHYANVFLVGMALQSGALPLQATSVEEAIALNGVAVERNIQAFRRGRQFIADRPSLDRAIEGTRHVAPVVPMHPSAPAVASIVQAVPGSELADLVLDRANDLIAYQNRGYAQRYAEAIERVRVAEVAIDPSSEALALVAARYLYKLMAYKDEYEVARLSIDPALRAAMTEEFGPGYRARYQLHPPLLRALGVNRKISLGRWFRPIFAVLYRMRWLRGTPVDIFGWARVRKLERQLLAEYDELLDYIRTELNASNLDLAVQLAALPDMVRGYEDIKLRNVERYSENLAQLRAEFSSSHNQLAPA